MMSRHYSSTGEINMQKLISIVAVLAVILVLIASPVMAQQDAGNPQVTISQPASDPVDHRRFAGPAGWQQDCGETVQ